MQRLAMTGIDFLRIHQKIVLTSVKQTLWVRMRSITVEENTS